MTSLYEFIIQATIGGPVNNGGTLNVYNSTSFEDNWADGSAGSGGALLSIGGDVNIVGAISKGSGTFKINHPKPEKSSTHWLYHSFVESPTSGDNLYRYRADIHGLNHTIILEEYHQYLNTCLLTQ